MLKCISVSILPNDGIYTVWKKEGDEGVYEISIPPNVAEALIESQREKEQAALEEKNNATR